MTSTRRWGAERANRWYNSISWPVGCNFIPSTAINQLEMWQVETFDPETIDRELGWAAAIGFNTMRVYLHDLLWFADADGFRDRMDRYLAIAAKHGIRTIFVLFDDCWNKESRLGPQPAPRPGIHNSGWLQSPGEALVLDPTAWPRLERYVTEVVSAFAGDTRVLMWDLYNEPGNRELKAASLPLLRLAFAWAREGEPSQPLTSGAWADFTPVSEFQVEASDVITFHNYNDVASLEKHIAALRVYGRPLICTEYMARSRGSRFETHLPIFKRENVGAINWGLVAGKTNTKYQWDTPLPGREPELWFHEVFHPDGRPYREEEVAAIKAATGR
jgi:hypothetical protein